MFVPGGLKQEVYTNIVSLSIADLTNNARFPDAPDMVGTVSTFETPSDWGDNYGERLTGFLVPPTTGDYVFYVASDDQGALYLSPDAEPAHKVQIAWEPTWSFPRSWTGIGAGRTNTANVSAPVRLESGRAYYVEALHQEGGGGDCFGVAWKMPGGAPPVDGSAPIAGAYLASMAPSEEELHLVGLYSGNSNGSSSTNHEEGVASVLVDRPGRRVTLLLSSYEPVLWSVTATNGTLIEKVILGGYLPQRVRGLDPNVEVVAAWRQDSGDDFIWIGYQLESMEFYRSLPMVQLMTGMEVGSFHGVYTAPYPAPIVIDAVQPDPRLRSDYPQPVPGSDLPDLSFQLAFFSGTGPGPGNVYFRNYTLAGPESSTSVLPGLRVVPDASNRYFYAALAHSVLRVDAQLGTAAEMPLGPGLPELSWSMGMAFDSLRNRELLVTLGGEGYLYAYAPDSNRWSLVSSMQNRDVDSIVHHPPLDAIFGFEVLRADYARPKLFRFSASGAYQGEMLLPMMPWNIGVSSCASELVSVGDYLVLLVGPDALFPSYHERVEFRMYLIDPRSGNVWLTYRYVPTNQPPTVWISSPANGSTFPPGADIRIAANAADTDGHVQSVEFFADGQSLGTTIPGSGFALTWSNAPAGPHSLTARATDNEGATSLSAPVSITVGEPVVPPVIVVQPLDQTAPLGAAVSFTVGATGTEPLQYQWQHDGIPMANRTNATLLLTSVSEADAGVYRVAVSNPLGGVFSDEAVLTVLPASTQPGSTDLSFDPMRGGQLIGLEGDYGFISALALQPDGKLIAAGDFIGASGVPRRDLVRLNPDGSADASFRGSIDPGGLVQVVTIQPNGQLLVAGNFAEIDHIPCRGLARLNPDGSVDPSFAPVLGGATHDVVRAIVVQPDGNILLAGNFTTVNDQPRYHVARVHPDGTLDSTFQPGLIVPASDVIFNCLTLQPDGKVLVGHATCSAELALCRLNADGSLDTGFHLGVPPAGWCGGVMEVVLQPSGKLVVYGNFGAWRFLARLHTDGSEDHSFVPPAIFWQIHQLLSQPDGKIVIAGHDSGWIGETPNGILRLNLDGSVDNGFQVPEGVLGHQNEIGALALRPDGRILLGKAYSFFNVQNPQAIVQLQPNGSVDSSFQYRLHPGRAIVNAILPLPDGRAIIGGRFTRLNDVPRVGLAGLNPDGTVDSSFVPPPDSFYWVETLARQADGRILVGGTFQLSTAPFSQNLVRLDPDGSLDLDFDLLPDFGGAVHAIVIQRDGKIVIGGEFNFGGEPPYYLARLNADGSIDASFNQFDLEGVDTCVQTIAVQPDGKILFGGEFFSFNGVPRVGIARIHPDGTLDESFNTDPDVTPWVGQIQVQPDGKILVLTYGNEPLIRLNPDGSPDPSFDVRGLSVTFWPILLQPDGKILVGFRSNVDGMSTPRGVLRLNPDGSRDDAFSCSVGGDGIVNSIALESTGKVLIGGIFEEVNGLPRNGIARLNNDLRPAGSFVTRQLPGQHGSPGNTVRLVAQPPANTSVYAVQDKPPTGWAIRNISHGGVFDSATAQVKFGPFFHDEPRILAYDAFPPPDFEGVGLFSGVGSVDGVNSPILGDYRWVIGPPHPADLNPSDWTLRIDEMTAYAAAWRTGGTWILPPIPIPIDYVTRAAMLWRGGETYRIDPNIEGPPLWWVNTSSTPVPASKDPAGLSSASRTLPGSYVPGEAFEVRLDVSPSRTTRAYAVEELIPAGWQVLQVSDGGQLDAIHGQVKWGPFCDSSVRTFRYQLLPPVTSTTSSTLAGSTSFDGVTALIGGLNEMRPGSRLTWKPQPGNGGWILQFRTGAGAVCEIETSEDLIHWSRFAGFTNTTGTLDIPIATTPESPQRYFRAKRTSLQ